MTLISQLPCVHGGALADLVGILALFLSRPAETILAARTQFQHVMTPGALRNRPGEITSLNHLELVMKNLCCCKLEPYKTEEKAVVIFYEE